MPVPVRRFYVHCHWSRNERGYPLPPLRERSTDKRETFEVMRTHRGPDYCVTLPPLFSICLICNLWVPITFPLASSKTMRCSQTRSNSSSKAGEKGFGEPLAKFEIEDFEAQTQSGLDLFARPGEPQTVATVDGRCLMTSWRGVGLRESRAHS